MPAADEASALYLSCSAGRHRPLDGVVFVRGVLCFYTGMASLVSAQPGEYGGCGFALVSVYPAFPKGRQMGSKTWRTDFDGGFCMYGRGDAFYRAIFIPVQDHCAFAVFSWRVVLSGPYSVEKVPWHRHSGAGMVWAVLLHCGQIHTDGFFLSGRPLWRWIVSRGCVLQAVVLHYGRQFGFLLTEFYYIQAGMVFQNRRRYAGSLSAACADGQVF